MQTWEAITSRRNVRSFDGRPIPAADLDRILEAGRRSPSSQNWQPWDFIVVTDSDQLRELAGVWRGAGHVAGSAATIVVVGPAADNEFGRAQLDLGQATMAMMLAAADLGIGSCHAGVADPKPEANTPNCHRTETYADQHGGSGIDVLRQRRGARPTSAAASHVLARVKVMIMPWAVPCT